MLRSFRLVLALCLACFVRAETPRRVVVGCNTGNPPYEYLDSQGKPAGYVIDLIQEVARNQGLELVFRPMPFVELRAAFDRREVDVLPGFIHSEERAKQAAFSIPNCYVENLLVVRKDDPSIRSERDLAGKRLIVMQSSVWDEYLKAKGFVPHTSARTHEEALLGVAQGRADYSLVPRLTYRHLVRRLGLHNLREVPAETYPSKRCFAVHLEASELLAKLNEGLLQAKRSGRMDELYERHLGALEAEVLPEMLLLRKLRNLLPGALAIGLVGALAWLFTLRRLVRIRTAALREELDQRQEAEARRALLLEEVRSKNRELESLVKELEGAMAKLRHLSGLLPICPKCKKIRNDRGFWQGVEEYVATHSEARFSHGMCPACVRIYFPEIADRHSETG